MAWTRVSCLSLNVLNFFWIKLWCCWTSMPSLLKCVSSGINSLICRADKPNRQHSSCLLTVVSDNTLDPVIFGFVTMFSEYFGQVETCGFWIFHSQTRIF